MKEGKAESGTEYLPAGTGLRCIRLGERDDATEQAAHQRDGEEQGW